MEVPAQDEQLHDVRIDGAPPSPSLVPRRSDPPGTRLCQQHGGPVIVVALFSEPLTPTCTARPRSFTTAGRRLLSHAPSAGTRFHAGAVSDAWESIFSSRHQTGATGTAGSGEV